jgi:AraC family ethanolamine operon transcriptional activator
MDNFQTFRFQSHDFDEISASLSRWNQTYHQLSAGPFFGDVEYLQIDGMEIFELHWGQVIHYQGLAPPGTIGFGLPLTFTGESRYLNRPVSNGQLLIQQCGSEGDLIGSRNFKIQVLTVNEQRFLNKLASKTGRDSRQLLHNICMITLSPVVTETLRRKFQTLIYNAHHHFRHHQVADTIRLLAEDLLDYIAGIVISGNFEQTKSRL